MPKSRRATSSKSSRHTPSLASGGMDYAGAWHGERGQCHRFVYTSDQDGRPMVCPELVVVSGWRQDWQRRLYAVDACEEHAPQLEHDPKMARHRPDATG